MPESRDELIRSRARVVAAGDETRRRIQRDLHDGAQQRLVQSIIALKLARADPSSALIDEALAQAERAMSDLRELVHGIMPAALSRGGLRSGVEALLGRVDLPVRADIETGRMPPLVESTAYFAIAEALGGAAARGATCARVDATRCDDALVVAVEHDGEPCGASPGLADRVAACGGTLSTAAGLTVTLPLA